MQTYFYGRMRIGSAALDARNLTLNIVSDYRPLGTDLIPDDTERNGGAFHDYSKGDPLGLEVWSWASHGVPTDDEVTLFQLSDLDRTPDPRARKLGKVQLLRDWWRRSESADGGMVMRWGFRVLAFDQQELLALVQSGEHHTLSFHPTQYELPATEGKKVTRKGKQKATQGNLPLEEGGEWPGEGKGEDDEVQQTRRELGAGEAQLQADCRVVAAAMDITGFQTEEELAVKSLGGGLTPEELERVSVAIAWLVDAGFARAVDGEDAPNYAMTPDGRKWLGAQLAAAAAGAAEQAELAAARAADAPAGGAAETAAAGGSDPELVAPLFNLDGTTVNEGFLADWLEPLICGEERSPVSLGGLRQLAKTHPYGDECTERDLQRAAALLTAKGLLTPRGKAGKLWAVNL